MIGTALALASALPPGARGSPPELGYVVARSEAEPGGLLSASEEAWARANRIAWGPDAAATSFRALWTAAGLAIRFDVTDAEPWHTLTERDARLWNEEVVEIFLDVGATGRSYAELEMNPVNAVVDLWVDRPGNKFDKAWDIAGLESRVYPRRDPDKGKTGWTAVAHLPWRALAAKAPRGAAVPPRPKDRWRFNVFRIERPGGAKEPEKGALFLPWSSTGESSFHVPKAFREFVFGP